MNICPLAPYTLTTKATCMDDTMAIVTLNNIWQAQGCTMTQPLETTMMGDYC